jgi:hypothetical protein
LLISNRCTKKFSEQWCESLLPILDKFIEERAKASKGEPIDDIFWNSMIKRGATHGSGSRTWFSGWFNIFFPYINSRWNRFCEPYSTERKYVTKNPNDHSDHNGPDIAYFPNGISKAPVLWDYHGTEFNLDLKSGFLGARQDAETGTIRPEVGWFIQMFKSDEDFKKE